MKVAYKLVLVAVAAIVAASGFGTICMAAEEGEGDFWSEGKSIEQMQTERREKMADNLLKDLAQTDPNKAKELAELRVKDQNKFYGEIKDLLSKRFVERIEGKEVKEVNKPPVIKPEPNEPGKAEREERFAKMRERHGEFIEWLKKNYPQDADKLTALKSKDAKAYARQLSYSYRRYWKIFEASDNPQMVENLKTDLALKDKRAAILDKVLAAKDEAQKQALITELKGVVSERFDLIIKRKQLEHQELRKRLGELKDKVEKSEAETARWKETKDQRVKEHVDDLIKQKERFSWE